MMTLLMSIGYLTILMSVVLCVYAISMYICGVNVISYTKPLFVYEKVESTIPKQNVVDMTWVRANLDITNHISRMASEWGIDITSSDDTTWIRHETAHYVAYSKK